MANMRKKPSFARDYAMNETARAYRKETGNDPVIVAVVDMHGMGSFSYIGDRSHALNLLLNYANEVIGNDASSKETR